MFGCLASAACWSCRWRAKLLLLAGIQGACTRRYDSPPARNLPGIIISAPINQRGSISPAPLTFSGHHYILSAILAPPHPRRAHKDFHFLAMQIKPSPINGPSFCMARMHARSMMMAYTTRITRQNCQRGLGKQSDNQQLVELMDDTHHDARFYSQEERS